jgi:hypothetical protein
LKVSARLIDGKTAKTDAGPAKLFAGRIRHFNLGVSIFQQRSRKVGARTPWPTVAIKPRRVIPLEK